MMLTRTFVKHNYRGLYVNGQTIRLALDPSKPITELEYPEFYDVKVTSFCKGNCPYCYQNSTNNSPHNLGIVDRFKEFFGKFNKNQRPFQIAFGGGEPTSHPEFTSLLQTCFDMGIEPNYTTNGMNIEEDLLNITKSICGGVAVSTHPHLNSIWRKAAYSFLDKEIHTNLHVIIGNKTTIDEFAEIYKEFSGKVKYFVLLPLSAQGRSNSEFNDWEYLISKIEGSPKDIAFGANFYPYLTQGRRFNVSLYEPEAFSAYLDLETMKVYKSSFSSEEKRIGS